MLHVQPIKRSQTTWQVHIVVTHPPLPPLGKEIEPVPADTWTHKNTLVTKASGHQPHLVIIKTNSLKHVIVEACSQIKTGL